MQTQLRNKLMIAATGLGLLIAAAPAMMAHHSFAAEFDDKKPIKLQGKVTKWELVNPHSWIHLDVKNSDGSVVPWMIEGGSPNALFRNGFTRTALPVGTEIIIEGFAAKDGANRAVGAALSYLDGKKLFMGGSAPGQPGGENK